MHEVVKSTYVVGRYLGTQVVTSEAELELAKCRDAESWPTFVSYVLCSTEFLWMVGGVRPAPGKRYVYYQPW